MKYTQERVKNICELIAAGKHTIDDVCKQAGINEATFYRWKKDKSDFCNLLKEAENQRLETFKNMAYSGLITLLSKHEYTELTIEEKHTTEGILRTEKRATKVILPNATAVIFTLTNLDKENFKHRQHTDQTTNGKDTEQKVTFQIIDLGKGTKPDDSITTIGSPS